MDCRMNRVDESVIERVSSLRVMSGDHSSSTAPVPRLNPCLVTTAPVPRLNPCLVTSVTSVSGNNSRPGETDCHQPFQHQIITLNIIFITMIPTTTGHSLTII